MRYRLKFYILFSLLLSSSSAYTLSQEDELDSHLSACSSTGAKKMTVSPIISIDNFHPILDELTSQPPDKKVLVVLDIHNVLLEFYDSIFRPGGTSLKKEGNAKLEEACGDQKIKIKRKEGFVEIPLLEFLKARIIKKTYETNRTGLLDETARKILDLQCENLKIMGLTAGKVNPYGEFDDITQLRLDQLKNAQIDLSKSFSDRSFPSSDDPLIFRDGVLFTEQTSKGKALKMMFQAVKWKPIRVLCVDDRLDWLKDIAQEMKVEEIEFSGYHLQHHKFFGETFSKELVEFQFDNLIKHHEWLNDDEAQKLLIT